MALGIRLHIMDSKDTRTLGDYRIKLFWTVNFMAVHIFVVDEKNYKTCIKKGLAGLPKMSSNPSRDLNTNEGLLLRISIVKKNDLVMFYIAKKKELYGVWRVLEFPFYDETRVWENEDDAVRYPYRVRIDNTEYNFQNPVKLNDIYDLRDEGLIWTFTLARRVWVAPPTDTKPFGVWYFL